jgi:hypothetical protein
MRSRSSSSINQGKTYGLHTDSDAAATLHRGDGPGEYKRMSLDRLRRLRCGGRGPRACRVNPKRSSGDEEGV